MIDDLARAFERPHAPAAADPLDRISVRDYVREVEIGAFRSERGVTQRVRFNVVLEVGRHAASISDDVDQVISYDMIVEAIDAIVATRINLLETCAERIAEKCLEDPRAVRVLVRIEKLDRIPGALGVEIVRNRLPEGVRKVVLAQRSEALASGAEARRPVVLLLGPEALTAEESARWRAALLAHDGPAVALAAPGALAEAAAGGAAALSLDAAARRRLALLACDQAAWALAGDGREVAVVETRTELLHAAKIGAPAIWAPFKLANDAEAPADFGALAGFLAGEIHAGAVLAAPGALPDGPAALGDAPVTRIAGPEDLSAA